MPLETDKQSSTTLASLVSSNKYRRASVAVVGRTSILLGNIKEL